MYDHYKRVFDYRQRAMRSRDVVSLDLENIEVLFSLVEMAHLLGDSTETMRSIRNVIADVVESTHRPAFTLRVRVSELNDCRGAEVLRSRGDENFKRSSLLSLEFYDFAVALMAGLFEPREREVENTIITFNYDQVIERAARDIGVAVDYGTSRLQRESSPETGAQAGTSLRLLKLHGSSNWGRPHDGRDSEAILHDSYAGTLALGQDPVVVPPTWKKGASGELLAEIWAEAFQAIRAATRISLIGYSLPEADAYFRYLLASAMSENPGIYGVSVVDVQNPTLAARYREFFMPQAEYNRFSFFPTDEDVGNGGIRGFLENKRFKVWGRGSLIQMVDADIASFVPR